MARGFRGMKDDFMEIINHIIRLSCCSIAFDDNYDGQLLPLPPPTVGDFACLEVSQVFSASDTDVRDDVATEDCPRSALACTGVVDDGNGLHFPQSEYVVIDEAMDPGFASARNALSPDSESLSSSQIGREKNSSRNYLERKSNWRPVVVVEEGEGSSKEIYFESASDSDIYSQKEGEDGCIQKHILVEDHLPSSISLTDGLHLRKRTNNNLDDDEITDYHEEYVIV